MAVIEYTNSRVQGTSSTLCEWTFIVVSDFANDFIQISH